MSVATRPSADFIDKMDDANDKLDEIAGLDWRLEVVPLDDVYVDKYQRPVDERWVKAREGDFRPWLLGTITVSERHQPKNGKRFALVDGQHRRELSMRHGLTVLPAVVFYNLSQADEAALFSAFQRERRSITAFQRFNADLIAGDPRAKAVTKIMEEEGFTFADQGDYIGDSKTVIKAVVALERVYDDDPTLLRTLLRLISRAWGELPYSTNDRLLRGLYLFLKNTPDFDEDRFLDRLGQVTPMTLLDRASKLREGRGASGALPQYMQEAINNVYRSRPRK